MADPLHQAKRPVSLLAGTYGHPLHPALVTVPLGAWVTSLIFDAASHLVHQPGFLTQGSLWLIAIGVFGALIAACAGRACPEDRAVGGLPGRAGGVGIPGGQARLPLRRPPAADPRPPGSERR